MTFLEAEERFQKLEEARRAGKLTYPQYVEAVHALRVVDDAGLVWMLQEQTGQWFVFTGGNWVAARPPVSAPPSPPPPPPAEPEIVSAPEPEVAPAAVEPAAEVEAPAEPEPAAAAEPEPIPPTAPLEPEAEPPAAPEPELPAHLKKPAATPGRGAGASALPPHLRAGGELPPHLRASGAVRAPIPPAPTPAARVQAPAARVQAPTAPTPAAPAPAAPAPAAKPAARTPAAPKSADSPKTGRYFLWFIIIWLVIAVVVYLIWGREQPGVLLGVALAAAGSFVWLLVTLNRSWSGEIINIKTEQVYSADDDGGDWEDITYAYVRQPNGKIRKERWIQGWEIGDRLEKRRGEAEIRCIHPNQ